MSVMTQPVVEHTTGDGEAILTHFAKKNEITYSLVHGTPITALCGKVWVPSRDPDRYPLCAKCSKRLAEIMSAR